MWNAFIWSTSDFASLHLVFIAVCTLEKSLSVLFVLVAIVTRTETEEKSQHLQLLHLFFWQWTVPHFVDICFLTWSEGEHSQSQIKINTWLDSFVFFTSLTFSFWFGSQCCDMRFDLWDPKTSQTQWSPMRAILTDTTQVASTLEKVPDLGVISALAQAPKYSIQVGSNPKEVIGKVVWTSQQCEQSLKVYLFNYIRYLQ